MPQQPPSTPSVRLLWLEMIKALAILWIITNHLVERIFGFPYIANPTADWPSLAVRLAQLQPLRGIGVWDVPVNLLRYVGWTGDQGVNLFFIASGFGLTWGLMRRSAPDRLALVPFYRARAARIYPLWWTLHAAAACASILLHRYETLGDPRLVLSAIGFRATPESLYYLVPSWWYIGSLIQMYLIFPFLWLLLRRYGPNRLMIAAGGIGLVVRGIGLLTLCSALDAWARGAWCITRLPEFVFGIWLAAVMHNDGQRVIGVVRHTGVRLLCALAYGLGTVLSLTLLGNAVAPLILGGSLFLLLLGAWYGTLDRGSIARIGLWLGRHSYGLFLVHQPIIHAIIPKGGADVSTEHLLLASAASVLLSLVATVGVEAIVAAISAAAGGVRSKPRLRWVAGAMLAGALSLLWVGEAIVERVAPQEVFGWGERPALEPDATVGWKLRPDRETRLRWECYDYNVSANALGFPGPLYPESRQGGSLRILTAGDAFTSAEGVDTVTAWPRRLEDGLRAQLGTPVEVMNFAITGYGPNQYAAVIEAFAPRYRPDLIMLGMFVNDLEDVLVSTRAFQASIGFGRRDPDGWLAFFTAAHLRRLISLRAGDWVSENLRRRPGPHGCFLGQIAALDRDPPSEEAQKRGLGQRLSQIAGVARQIGAQVVLVMIPAPAQICGPDSLAYYPHGINLRDRESFDMERPQRLIQEAADQLSLPTVDLRPVLSNAPACPYFSCNMHWTAEGHRIAAEALVGYVLAHLPGM